MFVDWLFPFVSLLMCCRFVKVPSSAYPLETFPERGFHIARVMYYGAPPNTHIVQLQLKHVPRGFVVEGMNKKKQWEEEAAIVAAWEPWQ